MRVKEEFTPARRWSFLVGVNENSHTAQSQLVDLVADDERNPALAQLEESFNIEKVTKEFFEKYRELFLWTKETIEDVVKKDKKIKGDFEAKGVETVDFSKKLLGQIVFLYFLQKKGWFGVKRDADWGTGPKNFLRELFEEKQGAYKNFFNDILEPLFYEALARERDDDFYSRFNCKIPFLNGGLFDPINDYDWVHTDILLPNDLFSNTYKTKEGDKGNGILDIFDRYNFTVKEDEPLEKEVAVDPEMLGKVFENLLEVKDRKSKGTYYTPREIVHYMCQQSLINYLSTELEGKVSKEDIEVLIKHGEHLGENETTVEAKGRETSTYFYKLPESIRQNADLIDEKLINIKVCDPAIGSGAFLVGMMGDIVKTRNVLSAYIKNKNRTIYNFKRECIEKSLYGVDIDSGAVEIAKLRLWLSLVVDEDDIRQIKPLPNLDYKIMQGNSLIEALSGEFLASSTDYKRTEMVSQLKKLKDELFDITSPSQKELKRREIDNLIKVLFDYGRNKQLEGLKQKILSIRSQIRFFEDERHRKDDDKRIQEIESIIKELKDLKIPGPSEHFEWHINFSEAFHEKGGFDAVIANPPYIRQEDIKEYKPFLQKAGYKVYNSTSDLYTYFYEISYNILAKNRFSCFISSNKWMRAKYGEKLRNFFKTKTMVMKLIDFGGHKIFDATVDTNIMLFQKNEPQKEYQLPYVKIESDFTVDEIDEYVNQKQQRIKQSELNVSGWTLADDKVLALKKKIDKIGTPLKNWNVKIYRGIITGFNEAFIIDNVTKELLCKNDRKSNAVIKPVLRGRDIGRYHYQWPGLWMIVIPSGWTNENRGKEKPESFFKNHQPVIYEHLKRSGSDSGKGKGLYNRDDQGDYWWELRDCDYYAEFEKGKIIYSDIGEKLTFVYDESGMFCNNTCYFINSDRKYLLAPLNSQLIDFYYRQISAQLGNGAIRSFTIYIEQLPIPQISEGQQKSFIILVGKILAITKDEDYLQNLAKQAKVKEYERQIDQMVYELYGFTKEEIKMVEKIGDKSKMERA